MAQTVLPTREAALQHFYGFRENIYQVTIHEPKTPRKPIPERFVQDLWRTQCFDAASLTTTEGEPIRVLNPGTLNHDSGPDFLNAHLRIGTVTWRGDVEVHTVSGRWFQHAHHEDARYDRVMLHVCLYPDVWTGGLLRNDGTVLPECILAPHLQAPLRELLYQYHTREESSPILCASQWTRVPEEVRDRCIQARGKERFRDKRNRLGEEYLAEPDLSALLHRQLFATLGYSKNSEPLRALARHLPRELALGISDPLDLEALHFGIAGLLPEPRALLEAERATADYVMELHERFAAWQRRLRLSTMEPSRWQFFRLRPANFPTLRIAQAVRLLTPGGLLHYEDPIGHLCAAIEADKPLEKLEQLLRSSEPGPFWTTHLRLTKSTKPRSPAIGRRRVHVMILNAIVPALLLHADQTGNPALETRLWVLLRALPPENDAVVRQFRRLGAAPHDALTTQGMHQLFRTGCKQGTCLSCPIGKAVLRSEASRT